MIAAPRERREGRRHLALTSGEEREKRTLTLATMARPVDTPWACGKGRPEVQGASAPIRMLDTVGDARLRGFRGLQAWPRLERGLCSEAEAHLLRPAGAGGEWDEGGHRRIAGGIAALVRRQPPRMPPWFALLRGEQTADG